MIWERHCIKTQLKRFQRVINRLGVAYAFLKTPF